MPKTFKYFEGVNMIKAVCSRRIPIDEIKLYISEEFEDGQEFTEDDLRRAVSELASYSDRKEENDFKNNNGGNER